MHQGQPAATSEPTKETTTTTKNERTSKAIKSISCCGKSDAPEDSTYQPTIPKAPVAQQYNEPGHLNWRLNLRPFGVEEVQVHVDGGRVCVTARHEERTDTNTVTLEYQNDMRLPDGVSSEAVTATRQPDGVLAICASIPSTVQLHMTTTCGATKCGPSDRVHCRVTPKGADEAAAAAAKPGGSQAPKPPTKPGSSAGKKK